MAARAVLTALVGLVALVFGVAIGGLVLVSVAFPITVIAAVLGVAFSRRNHQPAALLAYGLAVLAAVGAIIGFVDAIS